VLWALHAGRAQGGVEPDALPARPQQGLTSVEAGKMPEPYWRAAGFHVAGSRAVRIDMLERLSDLIRARVAYRPAEGATEAPTGATGDGGFRVVPDLMSVVGCSGEEFASILKALGFRRERRRLDGGNGHDAAVPETEAATAEPVFDEIWRPGKGKVERRPVRAAKAKPERRARPPAQAKPHQARPKPQQAKRERPAVNEHSPFAALKELRDSLIARERSEGS
jgi:ATP-dependent RNA helicase SUPV3L1/SUV3